MTEARLIQSLQSGLGKLPDSYTGSAEAVDAFLQRARMILRELFGAESDELHSLDLIWLPDPVPRPRDLYSLLSSTDDHQQAYEARKRETAHLLTTLAEQVARFPRKAATAAEDTSLPRLLRILRRFPLVARELERRPSGRQPLTLTDEPDVQDLLRALLHVDFDDVRPEEPTPSYAGKGSRMDFLLKDHGIVVETKVTRPGRDEKAIGSELNDDIARYGSHQDCRTLVCFVYDPTLVFRNAGGFERDLTGPRDRLAVHVVVAPKGT